MVNCIVDLLMFCSDLSQLGVYRCNVSFVQRSGLAVRISESNPACRRCALAKLLRTTEALSFLVKASVFLGLNSKKKIQPFADQQTVFPSSQHQTGMGWNLCCFLYLWLVGSFIFDSFSTAFFISSQFRYCPTPSLSILKHFVALFTLRKLVFGHSSCLITLAFRECPWSNCLW